MYNFVGENLRIWWEVEEGGIDPTGEDADRFS